MAQQNINIGTSANKGDGDLIRTAFTKVNANFTELFALHDGTLAQKADIQGSVFADDSTVMIDAVSSKINLDGTVKGNIIPDTNIAYDIGSDTKRFKDLYLSGTTIHLGSSTMSVDNTGNFQFSGGLKSNNPIVGDDSTLLVDTANSTIPYSVLSGAPTTVSGYGITDALALGTSATTALAGDTTFSFASITSTPTTVSGYGITDAQALLVSATNIKTINGATILGSGDLTVSASSNYTYLDFSAAQDGVVNTKYLIEVTVGGDDFRLPSGATVGDVITIFSHPDSVSSLGTQTYNGGTPENTSWADIAAGAKHEYVYTGTGADNGWIKV